MPLVTSTRLIPLRCENLYSPCIGGSRGGVRDARPPLGVQILSISCSFRENLACSRPPGGFTPPPRENPGSATALGYAVSEYKQSHRQRISLRIGNKNAFQLDAYRPLIDRNSSYPMHPPPQSRTPPGNHAPPPNHACPPVNRMNRM